MKTKKRRNKMKTSKQNKELLDLIELNQTDIKIFLDLILERQVDLFNQSKIEDLDTDTIRWAIQAKKSLNDLEEVLEVYRYSIQENKK
jgi:hypothetical protein